MDTEAKKLLLCELKKYQDYLLRKAQDANNINQEQRDDCIYGIRKIQQSVYVIEKDLGYFISPYIVESTGENK